MSKERGLLNLCAVAFKARNICPFLLTEISELLAQPEQDNIQYLLDQVARLTAENAMLKEKWSAPKQPEQEQEPVAWMQDSIELYVLEEKSAIRGYVIPLYTAPPTREPLSKEQYMKCFTDTYENLNPITDFVRAIEKAHGIGGGNE